MSQAAVGAPEDRNKYRTVRSLIASLLACFVVIGFLYVVTWRPREQRIPTVDYGYQLAEARRVAPWVQAPEPMPTGWQATSVRFSPPQDGPAHWHLGILTEQRKYVGLEQSDMTAARFQREQLGRFEPDGTTTVRGTTWQRKVLLDRRGENALVRTASGVTTIVVGDAGYPALEQLAGLLR